MDTRSQLLIAGTGALLLAVVLLSAGAPVWGWGGVLVLASITMAGAVATPRGQRGRRQRAR